MDLTVQSPQSVTWQVHIDRSMWIGGVRGLMLQALHPIAMRGVWQNSTFQEDPIGRLQRTADFVGVVTWGTAEEADRIGRKVRGIHKALRIKDPDTGRVHHVDDPELLLWVHCAEVSSYLEVARRAGLRLTDGQADRYFAEQRRSAAYVGLHEEDVPGSVAEMEAYFAEARPRLKVTPEARSAVRFLLWPKLPREMRFLRPGKPAYVPFGALCYYSMPRWARRMYGILPEVPQPVVTAALRSFRLTMNSLPEVVHDLSFQQATKDMLEGARHRLAEGGYDMSKGLYGLRDPRRWPAGV
ncbi:oxygenase MpaB family protein [Actinomadura sp. DC4]|uniref:oxygenase MpaB family protein n=1 Tax=Actinomadura sp. DC4 TaxID=3055069 RepID=UPI0025B14E6D|nr:oxygenase MpaB family protein [Actinomadura sp. DC4]MDN3352718.1 oxygenase MpaB family protein [Actinomadura sp. DC4]